MLWRIADQVRTTERPLVLGFDEHGLDVFDAFLAQLHAETPDSEGLEAAWLGKGAGTVARLAATLELLDWSGSTASRPPGPIGRAAVEAAIALWTDYFRPHAAAVFHRAGPTDLDRQARRVVRWFKDSGRTEVSSEDVRREGLRRSANASRTTAVLGRLQAAGIVRPDRSDDRPRAGRPSARWQVNPALARDAAAAA
jgi:hypothetical protein